MLLLYKKGVDSMNSDLQESFKSFISVSRNSDKGLESEYFDVEYRPSTDKSNVDLNNACSSLLTYLAMADAFMNEEAITILQEKFLNTLTLCNNEGEIENFAEFLEMIANMGGYASIFYSNNISLLNNDGVKYAKQKMDKIKKQKQRPVSFYDDDGIQSDYFDYMYKPDKDGNYTNLASKCNSLLDYLARTDISRDRKTTDKLQEKFLETLAVCQTDDDIKKFKKLMNKIYEKGGYAIQVIDSNLGLINKDGIIKAKEELKSAKNNRLESVSSIVKDGMDSEYFDIEFKPKFTLKTINDSCNSLITYIALADITRKKEEINNLMMNFYKILIMCETQEDFNELAKFVNALAEVGGYAIEFNEKVHNLINKDGKIKAQELINNKNN